MKLKPIAEMVTRKFGRQILKVQKHSPALLFTAGVVGVVGAAVLASRATLQLDEILMDTQDHLDKIRSAEVASYTDEMRQRDLVVVYTKASLRIARAYAPAVGVGVLSIVALTGSHVILTKRNAALTAAYAVLDRGFRQYRERVQAELGIEKETELRYGLTDRQVYDDETGAVTTVRDRMTDGSLYARLFDETNRNWSTVHNHNQFFLASQQQYCNDLLRAQGHLFLNEVYDLLGMERSREGSVVGWVYNPCDASDDQGDGYVDFGVFVGNREMGMKFARGHEKSIWLDFNVDGVIWDKI